MERCLNFLVSSNILRPLPYYSSCPLLLIVPVASALLVAMCVEILSYLDRGARTRRERLPGKAQVSKQQVTSVCVCVLHLQASSVYLAGFQQSSWFTFFSEMPEGSRPKNVCSLTLGFFGAMFVERLTAVKTFECVLFLVKCNSTRWKFFSSCHKLWNVQKQLSWAEQLELQSVIFKHLQTPKASQRNTQFSTVKK